MAQIFSEVLGREITYSPVTSEEQRDMYMTVGVPKTAATVLAFAVAQVANGAEEKVFKDTNKYCGRKTLRAFIAENKDVWPA